jgi:hypothetical protein
MINTCRKVLLQVKLFSFGAYIVSPWHTLTIPAPLLGAALIYVCMVKKVPFSFISLTRKFNAMAIFPYPVWFGNIKLQGGKT